MRLSARKLVFAISAIAAGTAWANALWFQQGKHPAPLFAQAPQPLAVTPVAHRSPPEGETLGERMRARTGEMKELQRRLRLLGFYDGPIDGLDGPQTQMAVGFYQSAHGLSQMGMSYGEILDHVRSTSDGLDALPPKRPGS